MPSDRCPLFPQRTVPNALTAFAVHSHVWMYGWMYICIPHSTNAPGRALHPYHPPVILAPLLSLRHVLAGPNGSFPQAPAQSRKRLETVRECAAVLDLSLLSWLWTPGSSLAPCPLQRKHPEAIRRESTSSLATLPEAAKGLSHLLGTK